MNRKELNKTVMMISNWKIPFGFQGFYKKNRRLLTCNKHLKNPYISKQAYKPLERKGFFPIWSQQKMC